MSRPWPAGQAPRANHLIGSNAQGSTTTGAGTNFTSRQISGWDGNILEDRIVTSTGAYNATAPISPSAAWIMQMAAFKAASSGGDTTAPSAPTGLTATVVSSSQINLSWTASTDNVGVTGYRVERCQGASCSTFSQIGTPTATSFSDTGLPASTSYSYRVRATDAAGNLSAYSSTVSGTTSSNPIAYVQSKSNSPNSSSLTSIAAAFTSAQTAGNFNVVAVGWGTGATVSSVADSKGNAYSLAIGPSTVSGVGNAAIYYAPNIAAATAGSNTVTVTFSAGAPFPDIRIAEYAGVSTTSPLDVTAVANGTGTTSDTNANDLIIGSNSQGSTTTGAGTNFTSRQISGWDGNILEDRIVSSAGAYNATAPISPSASWIMQMAAFKAAGGGDTTAPTAPSGVTATAASATQVNLSWTASTDNIGVTGYRVERCSGSGCSTFSQIATPTGTSYSDTGLTASTSYSYRVRATDASNNLSAYSSPVVSVTTSASSDTQAPTAPTSLVVLASSSSEVDLTWGAATDNVGVSLYLVERCLVSSCTYSQIGTIAAPPYFDTTVAPSTAYNYRVRAQDAATNTGPYSNVLSTTTPANSPDCN